jgi:hypothetical protein
MAGRARDILRPHPAPPSEVAAVLVGSDEQTASKRQHRVLAEVDPNGGDLTEFLRAAVVEHHNDAETRKRLARLNQRLVRQGLPTRSLYPSSETTQKGNLAEIVLAEYISANEEIDLPIYRLRYNPNIEQSMKGDDVLAFDLDVKPIRVLVGESKFRSAPRREDVEEIVNGLLRSHKAKIPASLQFVANQLFREGNEELGKRIEECHLAIGRGTAIVEYVGLLLSNDDAARMVGSHTPAGAPRRLAMISLGIGEPETLVADCFRDLR